MRVTVFALSLSLSLVGLTGCNATFFSPVPTITSFTASPTAVTAGGTASLTGVFADGTGAITPGNIAVTSGTAVSVTPTQTTTYILTVTNKSGGTSTQTATVTVNPAAPAITSFAANPASIALGGSTSLTGVFANGTGVITPGNIAVTSGTAVTVTPTDTTTYTLTVTNSAGVTAFQTATVTLLAAQSITFANPGAQTVGTTLTLTATASSGLMVAFASTTTGVCTVTGTTATFLTAGTCTIQAMQPGKATYAVATPVTQSFTVSGGLTAQTITFANPGAQTVGTPLTLSATASSSLTVAFASTTTSVCTVSGTTATFIAAGTCTIQATQPGNTTYAAATPVTQSVTVSGGLTAQTITFANPGTQTVGTPLTLTATASSGLAVNYASTTPTVCTLSGTTATFLAVGTCTINAAQAGNSTYAAATMVTRSFAVNAAPLTMQTITFAQLAAQTVGTPLTLTATASSGLAVNYASTTPTVCTVSGTTVTFLAGGTCTINATQGGDSTYAAATPVARSFTVNSAVGAPVINDFWVSNGTPTLGTSLTLWWSVTNATSVSIDQGIGIQTNSFVVITPASTGTVTYTLTASNSSGSTTATASVVIAAPTANSPKQLTIQNHWFANSGGHYSFPASSTLADQETWNGNAQNFLTDMGVYSDPNIFGGVPLVYTLSYYDETGLGNSNPTNPNPQVAADQGTKSLDAVYYNGQRIGKGFSGTPAVNVDSLRSVNSTGLVAHVENFYGRFFNFNGIFDNPPPTGSGAPYVSLSDGRSITAVVDPTAVDFDLTDRLWIADNGPDQNIKIFDLNVSLTAPVATFGVTGGVFAGPTPGLMGPFRFWGPRGIAHDASGHIYIASTGLPMQTIGGTDIREFSADGTTLLWQANGTFVDAGDSDPASQGTQMYVNGKHYTMDYTKAPGQSWGFTGVTLNPFTNPDDPRVNSPFESPWVRRINGQKFLFLGNMYGGHLYILRFQPNSEIAVPAAFLGIINTNLGPCAGSGTTSVDITPYHPCWTANETNKRIHWWWLDNGVGGGVAGDGHFDTGEFGTWNSYSGTANGIDVDDAGGIWYGGSGTVSTYFGAGGLQYWPNSGVDSNGVPIYDFANPKRFDVPFTDGGGAVERIKYVSETDTLYLAGAGDAYYPANIYRYNNFVKNSPAIDQNNPALELQPAFVINLGTTNFGQSQISLDQNSPAMTLPWTFTADQDYIYVAYLDQGKDGRQRGEVTVYSATDGHEIGWIDPGPEVGYYCGAVDLINGINVTTDASGSKIITLEEDGAGKVMAYRWNPATAL